jgi:hypothetical protein
MFALVLSVIAGWLVLSAVTAATMALLTRGGALEDERKRRFDADLHRLLADRKSPRRAVPQPDGTAR